MRIRSIHIRTDHSHTRTRRMGIIAFAATASILLVAGLVSFASPAGAAAVAVGLGTAQEYSVLAGTTVTNTGSSVLAADAGVSPGSAVVGFPPGIVVPPGVIHAADAPAGQAQVDLTTAYNDAAGQASTANLTGQDLGGLTLITGVYDFSTSAQLTGALTLNGQGNPASVFIIRAGSTLTTASASSVTLIGGAQACNVFWQVGSSATLGTTSAFKGTILALTSITLNTGATVEGRALARNGAVTLDSNTFTAPGCVTTPIVTPSASASAATTPPVTTPSLSTLPGNTPVDNSGSPPLASTGPRMLLPLLGIAAALLALGGVLLKTARGDRQQ